MYVDVGQHLNCARTPVAEANMEHGCIMLPYMALHVLRG
jgi:hypothetical protein